MFSDSDMRDVETTLAVCIDKLGLEQKDVLNISIPPESGEGLNTEGSVEWFTKSPEFQTWKDKEHLALLWLHGAPGCGKTVIMSYVLEHLPRYFGYARNWDIAAIFCSKFQSESLLVMSLVFQLMKSSIRAHAALTKLNRWPISLTGRELTKHLWELLEILIIRVPARETIFLIDAMDEVDTETRSSFLNNFLALEKQVQSSATLRVLLSSRPYSDLQETLSHYVGIEPEKERKGDNLYTHTIRYSLTTVTECLRTLFFQEWNARETRIETVNGGGWLSRHKEYLKWSNNLGSDFLWIEGKPGSGKSTLSKQIVRKLREEHWRSSQGIYIGGRSEMQEGASNLPDQSPIIAEFYYSFRGGITETSHELMLRSIVYQAWSQNARLFPILRDHYRELKKKSDSNAEKGLIWSYSDLKSALQSLHQINFPLKIFIIVDGMDESDNTRRDDILNFLHCLSATTSNCVVKILVASRPETDISTHIMQTCRIVLQEVNMEDIRKAVDRGIDELEGLCGGRKNGAALSLSEHRHSTGDFFTIKNYIVENSQGVFLWVSLVLKDLDRCVRKGAFTMTDLEGRVRKLPKELGGPNGFYRATIVETLVRSYMEDENQDEEEREKGLERGRRILAWVTFPKRPISIGELEDVLATPPQLDNVVLPNYDLEQNRPRELERGILSYCGTLVEVSLLTPLLIIDSHRSE